ncbi:MAG: DUF4124 domain-containing protein [Gammaproteobacteria bacterium]|nr:DUF4124 domain-containing protein [Gammaproteobacteria bacterium]MBQ0841098.1 DUF4124 domain-containing protein [Gammaproteobacteria bacterium]
MKKLTTTLASLILLTSPALFAGEVYRVVSEDGEITFTDSPPTNVKAQVVDLPQTNIAVAPPKRAKADDSEATGDEVPYTSVRIAQPLNNATIPPGHPTVAVQLALKPALQEGHLVQLYVDGRAQGSPSSSGSFSVGNLTRGEHKLNAEILGADKKRRAKTQSVTIHVKRGSANNKTSNRPRPTPRS